MSRGGRPDPDGTDPQLERLSVLAGTKGDKRKRAVLVEDLDARVTKIIDEREARLAATALDGTVGNFNASIEKREAGPFNWVKGESRNIPPLGFAGSALLMKRGRALGAWLAAVIDGGRGLNEPRAFLKSTSAQPADWGDWREIYHEGNVVGGGQYPDLPFGSLGLTRGQKPRGPLAVHEINGGQNTIRIAFGVQIVWQSNITLTFDSINALTDDIVFDHPFTVVPVPIITLPTSGYTNLNAIAVAHAEADVTLSGATINARKVSGATDFAANATITGIHAAFIGMWWDF